jgi:hypothetical protein
LQFFRSRRPREISDVDFLRHHNILYAGQPHQAQKNKGTAAGPKRGGTCETRGNALMYLDCRADCNTSRTKNAHEWPAPGPPTRLGSRQGKCEKRPTVRPFFIWRSRRGPSERHSPPGGTISSSSMAGSPLQSMMAVRP